MRDLAPDVFRQRLLIEGIFRRQVDEDAIGEYFGKITKALNLEMYGEPIIFSPGGLGKEQNQGYDAFVPLIDSGISVYVWTKAKLLSIVMFTCKGFDEKAAVEVTKEFFDIGEIEYQSF